MKETIKIEKSQEILSLATGISFSCVPCWYNGTVKDLKMDLIIPKWRQNHAACPAIVWICGGAYMVVDRSIWMPQLIDYAKAGYVVASVEYRTSNESQFPAQLVDVKAAIRFLKAHAKEFCVDPERIAVMGESAGGALASLVGSTAEYGEFEQGSNLEYDSSVRGVVNFYGPAILEEGGCGTNEDVPDWTWRAYLGANYTRSDLERANAYTYLSNQAPPFLLLHGTEDPVVPVELSRRFYEMLQEYNIDVDLVEIEGAGHGDDLLYQSQVVERVLQFLERIGV